MKFNWGTGIVIGMVAFMGFIITLSTRMIGTKVDLVTKDYYEQGIEHEQHMEEVRAAKDLSQPVEVEVNYSASQLEITFPKEFSENAVTGKTLLFFPADANKDKEVPLQLNANLKQTIPLEKLGKGVWRVKLHWECNAKKYYYEKEVII